MQHDVNKTVLRSLPWQRGNTTDENHVSNHPILPSYEIATTLRTRDAQKTGSNPLVCEDTSHSKCNHNTSAMSDTADKITTVDAIQLRNAYTETRKYTASNLTSANGRLIIRRTSIQKRQHSGLRTQDDYARILLRGLLSSPVTCTRYCRRN